MEELLCKFKNFFQGERVYFELDEIYSILIVDKSIDDYGRIKIMKIPTKQLNLSRPYSIIHDYSSSYSVVISYKRGIISLTKSRNTPLEEAHFNPVILKDYQEMDISQFNLSYRGTIKQIYGLKEILEFIVENWNSKNEI